MVKIRLLDDPEVPVEDKAFLALERHEDGFAVVLVDSDGDKISQPFVLFLEPNSEGKLALSLATTPNPNFISRNSISNAITVNPSH
ncbi:hypothetical protein LCGC14_2235260 [marine sediment metagenome]|uniref:Uncharacterized protein n=1 Tax=marine sediment metagenome TaxID=412755 RepID=A0A0F9G227_9ZZZZ